MWHSSTATLGDLIRSERVLPGALARVSSLSPVGVRNSLAAFAADLDVTGTIYRDGPHGATLAPDEATIRAYSLAYGKSWLPLDYAIVASGLEGVRAAIARKMPLHSVTVRENRIVVRAATQGVR